MSFILLQLGRAENDGDFTSAECFCQVIFSRPLDCASCVILVAVLHSEVVKQNDQIESIHDDAVDTKDNIDKVGHLLNGERNLAMR